MLCSCRMLGSLTGLLAMGSANPAYSCSPQSTWKRKTSTWSELWATWRLHLFPRCPPPPQFHVLPVRLLPQFPESFVERYSGTGQVWAGVQLKFHPRLVTTWRKNAFLHAQGWPAVAPSTSLTHLEIRTQAAGAEVNKCFLEWKGHPVCR